MFDYLRPQNLDELAIILKERKGEILFYSGGTEIVSQYRQRPEIAPLLVDVKSIQEASVVKREAGRLTLGANVNLNELEKIHPDLSKLAKGIADRTIRNRITLGGNVCGKLPYREIVLGLLALGARVTFFGAEGLREEALQDVFDKFLKRGQEELVLSFEMEDARFFVRRFTRSAPIDYPILTMVARNMEQGVFVGLSGYGAVPIYGNFADPETALQHFLPLAVDNDRASADYRKRLLQAAFAEWEEA